MKKGNKENLRMKFCCENWKTKEYVHLNIFHDKTIDLLPRQPNKQRGSFFCVSIFGPYHCPKNFSIHLRGEGRQARRVGDEERRMRYKIEAKEWGTQAQKNRTWLI